MTKPQQNELRRSGLGATDQDSIKSALTAASTPQSSGNVNPVPQDNQPGHHPEHEQDKPEGPPPHRA